MSERRRVVVTGLGAVTPIGHTVAEFWKNLLAGVSGAAAITQIDVEEHKTKFACEVKNWDPSEHFDKKDARKTERFVQFAQVAAREAMKDSGLDLEKVDRDRFGTYVGSGIGGIREMEEQARVLFEKGPARISPFLITKLICNMAPGLISMEHGLRGPNSCVVTACATGTNAIGDAMKIIARGDADLMVAGGSEAAITHLGLGGFENMRALSGRNDSPQTASRPFDKDRDGFVMGEGAGILVLEEYEHAKARGARIYGEVAGYGMSADAHHITAPAPGGEGAARAMAAAVKDSGLAPGEIAYVNAHGTSTNLNDKSETAALKTVFGEHASKLAISSNKSMIGHLLGAAGGVEAVASFMTMAESMVPPTINYTTPDPECDLDYVPNEKRAMDVPAVISNSFGFGGHNASLVFRRVE
ncbi:MAG: beta-ketoacyl-ACP synthase II [Sumerlaeia bacterium]